MVEQQQAPERAAANQPAQQQTMSHQADQAARSPVRRALLKAAHVRAAPTEGGTSFRHLGDLLATCSPSFPSPPPPLLIANWPPDAIAHSRGGFARAEPLSAIADRLQLVLDAWNLLRAPDGSCRRKPYLPQGIKEPDPVYDSRIQHAHPRALSVMPCAPAPACSAFCTPRHCRTPSSASWGVSSTASAT